MGRQGDARGSGKTILHTHGCISGDSRHEAISHAAVAERLAGLLELRFAGDCGARKLGRNCYVVPQHTLSGAESAKRLNIKSEHDLLGAWLPEAFMAGKAIMHPLIPKFSTAPASWRQALPALAINLVLPGFTAFCRQDASAAAHTLLGSGPVRLKRVNARGGHGQTVVSSPAEIEPAIDSLDTDISLDDPLVVETNLREVTTYGVGQIRLPRQSASYWGTQFRTTNNQGKQAYGGTELFVVPGGYDDLLAHVQSPMLRDAIACAMHFDGLADRYLPEMIASRRNYDVACGIDPNGTMRIGVLEQSWRVGGATAAEILALEALANDPTLAAVRARTVEIYGGKDMPPEDALVGFDGEDEMEGPLLKFARVEARIACEEAEHSSQ
ncbi:DUF3182 family protein [Aquamicrobium sp. LC103]|uniref:DUF3182 family protein n=1 Tax=Aquamicrobium sp. LC103 TaxID=1120658 RepID=UPI00063E8B98|nr:DUF3182 family protein [Aquamicrobium sp. LC103]TKT74728.1 DUF3182 family protein [Aquamicrobium sp. LC103]